MQKNTRSYIQFIGGALIILGVIQFIMNAGGIWLLCSLVFHPSSFEKYTDYLFNCIVSLLMTGLPIAAIIAGYGLLKDKLWSWRMALITCAFIFILYLINIIYFAVLCYQWRDTPIPSMPDGVYVENGRTKYVESGYISMWPSYVFSAASMILLMLLNQKSIKDYFKHLKVQA